MHEAENGTPAESASKIIAGKIPMLRPSLPASRAAQSTAGNSTTARTLPAADRAMQTISEEGLPRQATTPRHRKLEEPDLESIEAYVLAYYYAALTNLFCQAHLSPLEGTQDDEGLRAIADSSYDDFCVLDRLLDARAQDEIQASPHWPLYLRARDDWKKLVKNCAMMAALDCQKQIEAQIDNAQT